jgi:hypothetical protein
MFGGNEIIGEILKDMGFQSEEKPSSIENSGLVRDIKTRIKELGIIENKAHIEREALTHMCDYIIAAFKGETKPPVEKPPAQKPEAPKAPETPKATDGTSSQPEASEGTSSQKIDADASDDLNLVVPRLKILEEGAAEFIKILKDAPMTKRFKKVGDMFQDVATAYKINPEHNRIQRTARLEMAMGNAITFLQTSKLAARFSDLKEARKIAEDTMAKKAQV